MYRNLTPRPRSASSPAQAIALFEETPKLPGAYASIDRAMGGVITAAMARGEFSAARGSVTVLYPSKGPTGRLLILGLGKRDKFTGETVRVAAAKALRAAWGAKLTRLAFDVAPGLEGKLKDEDAGRALGEGLALANFEFSEFRGAAGPAKAKAAKPSKAVDLSAEFDRSFLAGVKHGLALSESVNFTRRLAATPPNVANPTYLVRQAQQMARQVGLRCRIIDARQAARLKMGGLLAVGGAGSSAPALICLEHKPSNAAAARGKGPVLLVGKAVTFDTGGYSIKPADGMASMKYDKCGGMAVLGAMRAIASMKLPVHVVGLVPAAENMISDKAYRPGDIVRFYNGVTAEITNTDAEGRVILADALSYGTRTYKPQAVIDLATLTGAIVVALGTACAGAFVSNSALRGRLFDAADYSGERLWHMPLWDEHRQLIQGTHGDIINAGIREAGASQGAAFLSYFIEPDCKSKLPDLPWCHLDIAGVADVKSDGPVFVKGPTGFGVRLLVRALETWGKGL